MAGFSYGASSHLLGDDSFGQEDDVLQRSADEDIDELVQRNIRDVLQQVGVDDDPIDDDFTPANGRTDDLQPHEQHIQLQIAAGGGSPGPRPKQRASHIPHYSGGDGQTDLRGGSSTQQMPDDDFAAPTCNSGSGPSVRRSQGPQQQRTAASRPSVGAQQHPRASGVAPAGAAARRSSNDTGQVAGPRLSIGSELGPQAGAGPRAGGGGGGSGLGGGASSTSLLDVPSQPEASLRLHKARIKALEEDLGRANRALLDREKQLTEALRELKDLRTQAASWSRDKKALEGQLDRARKQATDAEAAARNTESQVRELAKADSRAERERRATEAEVRLRDVRLQRALEEVERYKQLLNEVRAQEREAKGSAQQDTGRLLAENRKLERQRAELITAFKKQLKLIEVLKRQKVHLEAARALQFSEEEFLKTLEMGAT